MECPFESQYTRLCTNTPWPCMVVSGRGMFVEIISAVNNESHNNPFPLFSLSQSPAFIPFCSFINYVTSSIHPHYFSPFHLYLLFPPLSSSLAVLSLLSPSSQSPPFPSILPLVFLDLCSPKGSAPPQPRRLPGDGGQQEAGGQCSGSRRQQLRLRKLHDIQRHGALLCPTVLGTPSILQWLSLLTQPNCYHGQRAAT